MFVMVNRREFLQFGGVVSAAGVTGVAVGEAVTALTTTDPVKAEMERRIKFLVPPQGTPPDLLSQPSPPVTPFQKLSLTAFRPPVAKPLFKMTGPLLDDELSSFTPGTLIEDLSDEDWNNVFQARFKAIRSALSQVGFLPTSDHLSDGTWSVRGDRIVDGHIKIDIGTLPKPDRHQRFWEFRPHAFYINREVEFGWEYHPQYGSHCWTWGYHFIYGEYEEGTWILKASQPCSPGPSFHSRYGAPILTRRLNDLPDIGHTPAHSYLKFAYPSTTSHLHNAHTASESDGFPNDWINPGEYWDHHYGNFPSGHDDREKLSTLWYHDHRMDFTASNVYAGLDGFYLLFDEEKSAADAIKGDLNDETLGWRLPSGDFDIPLILHDLLFAQEVEIKDEQGNVMGMAPRKFNKDQTTRWTFDSSQDWDDHSGNRGRSLADGTRKAIQFKDSEEHYTPSPQVIFDGFNTDGIIGDRWTVNRRIQPLLEVKPRKYRLRLLNGGPSRFYELFLHADSGETGNDHPYGLGEKRYKRKDPEKVEKEAFTKPTSELERPFIVICGDGNFQPNPVLANSIYLGVAQRVDVIIDFSRFKPGTTVYLVNRLEQENGRGPTERKINPSDYNTDEDFFKANAVIAFQIQGTAAESTKGYGLSSTEETPNLDPSAFPLLFREFPPIDFTEVKRERLWEFDYDGGLWTINGRVFDPNRIDAGIEQDSAEIWTFRNAGNGWHHPIHSHFTEFLILERNNTPFLQGTIQTGLIAQGDESLRDTSGFAPRSELSKIFGSKPMDQIEKQSIEQFAPRINGMESAVKELQASCTRNATEAEPLPEASVNAFRQALRSMDSDQPNIGPLAQTRISLENLGFDETAIRQIIDDVSAIFGLRALRLQVRNARKTRKATLPTELTIDKASDLLVQIAAPTDRLDAVEKIMSGRFDELVFRSYDYFVAWVNLMPDLGLGSPIVSRFMGGARRDVAVLQPNTEVTVFARWKDFLGKHVMHCHNVVHEDHAMMIRWEIMPKNEGFDRARHTDETPQVGEQVSEERREHIEAHPQGGAHQPDDH
jgi:FtsP/CotA-like multicopper oxidase with cupredoxin domain